MLSFKQIWKDPVMSKIISGVIGVPLFTALVSCIIGAICPDKSLFDLFVAIFSYTLPVWAVLILSIAIWIWGYRSASRHKEVVAEKPEYKPGFLKENQLKVGQFYWSWRWERDATGKYRMKDFSPICPQCKQALSFLGMYSKYYKCANGHEIPFECVKHAESETQIKSWLSKTYQEDMQDYFIDE